MNFIKDEYSKQHNYSYRKTTQSVITETDDSNKGNVNIIHSNYMNCVKTITNAAWSEINLICISKDFIS